MKGLVTQVVSTLIVWMVITLPSLVSTQKTSCPEACRCYEFQVDCTATSIDSIPSVIPEGTVIISLSRNEISEVSSADFPSKLKSLHTLLLHDNYIRSVQRRALTNLPALQYLDLKNNCIRVIEPKTFEGCSKLTRLVLDHNLIDYIYMDSFYGLDNLVLLQLEANNIQSIDIEAFQHTPKLEKLYLNNNKFLVLPASGPIFKIPSLLTLEMDNCNITGLSPKTFDYMPNIIYLKLRGNYLQREDLRSMVKLKSLKFLHLEFNSISYIHPNTFDGINLQWLYLTGNDLYMSRNHPFLYSEFLINLDISFCGIKDIHPNAFSNFTRIIGLNLKWNQLTTFYIDSNLDNLASLSLSHNKFMYLEPGMFTHLPNLMFLEVSFNFINAIDPETFAANTRLSYLDLQSNQLILSGSGTLFSLPSLRSLDLSSCGIGDISSAAFLNMTSLQELKLGQNALESVDFSGSLGNLTSLDISGNRIIKLHGYQFLGLNALTYINASRNPLDCESLQDTWFWCAHEPVKIEAECTFSYDAERDAYRSKCSEARNKKIMNPTIEEQKEKGKQTFNHSINDHEAGSDVAIINDGQQAPVMNMSMRVMKPDLEVEVVNEFGNDTSGNYVQYNDSSSYNVSSVISESKESMSTWWILFYVCIGSVSFLVLVFVTTLSLDCYRTRKRRNALERSSSVKRSNSRARASKMTDGKDPALRPLQGNFRRHNPAGKQKRQRKRDSITSVSRSSGEHPRYISAAGHEPEDTVEPLTYRPHELWSRQFREASWNTTAGDSGPQNVSSQQSPSAPGYPVNHSSWSRQGS